VRACQAVRDCKLMLLTTMKPQNSAPIWGALKLRAPYLCAKMVESKDYRVN
jgi:hypothetical protein